jgi:hypothetical protein
VDIYQRNGPCDCLAGAGQQRARTGESHDADSSAAPVGGYRGGGRGHHAGRRMRGERRWFGACHHHPGQPAKAGWLRWHIRTAVATGDSNAEHARYAIGGAEHRLGRETGGRERQYARSRSAPSPVSSSGQAASCGQCRESAPTRAAGSPWPTAQPGWSALATARRSHSTARSSPTSSRFRWKRFLASRFGKPAGPCRSTLRCR